MNKIEENHYRMFGVTRDYLDDNTEVWSAIPKIVEYKNDLDALFLRITELSGKVLSGTSVVELKTKLRKRLAVKVSILSGALVSYFNDNENEDMAKAMSISKSDVDRCNEVKLTELITPLLDAAREILEDLAAYGVTEETLTEVATTLDDHNVLIGKPRLMLNKKFASIKTIGELVDKANTLLNDHMDNLMMKFIETNPEFYDGYKRARVIVDR